MVYIALDDTLSMELAEVFLEFWLRIKAKHVAILGCGLVILENYISMRVVAHIYWLHMFKRSRVVASDVANLVLRIRIVIRRENSNWRYRC